MLKTSHVHTCYYQFRTYMIFDNLLTHLWVAQEALSCLWGNTFLCLALPLASHQPTRLVPANPALRLCSSSIECVRPFETPLPYYKSGLLPFTRGQSGHVPLHKPWLCLPDLVLLVKESSLLTKLKNVCLHCVCHKHANIDD